MWENGGLLVRRGLDRVIGDLARLGYMGRWHRYGAADIGANHKRVRCWILAYSNKTRDARRTTVRKDSWASNDGMTLLDAAMLFPTPTSSDYRSCNPRERKGQLTSMFAGGLLNPDWVDWLMGCPIGWSGLKPLGMDKYQQWLQLHGIF